MNNPSDVAAADRVRDAALTEITKAADGGYRIGYQDAVMEITGFLVNTFVRLGVNPELGANVIVEVDKQFRRYD